VTPSTPRPGPSPTPKHFQQPSAHPRNKTDDELKLIADHDGFVGLTFFPPLLRHGPESTIDDYLDAAEHVMNLVGETQVGIGTDFTENRPPEFFEYISHDKGTGRRLVDFGEIAFAEGLRSVADLPTSSWPCSGADGVTSEFEASSVRTGSPSSVTSGRRSHNARVNICSR
jgi:hypothetical protein